MKADCQGIVREPRGREGSGQGEETERRERREKRIEQRLR